jgi:hypothetical protein
MIKLSTPVTLKAAPYTDNNNQLVTPEAIIVTELDVIYHDHPKNKAMYATINGLPGTFLLFGGDHYDEVPFITKDGLNEKLLSVLGPDIQASLQAQFPKTVEQDPDGPGTILTNMIKSIGITSSSNCACRRHAIEMNEKGSDWCEQHLDTILSWLKEESKKRNLPFVEFVAKSMVQRAIYKSRRLKDKKESDA